MKSGMSIYYDEEGDFLEITTEDISNCYFDNIGNGIFGITDKSNKKIKGIAIFSFKLQNSLNSDSAQKPLVFDKTNQKFRRA